MSEVADTRTEKAEEKKTDLTQNFRKGVFLIAMLLSLVATFQVYFSIENIIEIWFEYQYAPIFRAVYNFLVLVVSIYIIRLYIINR